MITPPLPCSRMAFRATWVPMITASRLMRRRRRESSMPACSSAVLSKAPKVPPIPAYSLLSVRTQREREKTNIVAHHIKPSESLHAHLDGVLKMLRLGCIALYKAMRVSKLLLQSLCSFLPAFTLVRTSKSFASASHIPSR